MTTSSFQPTPRSPILPSLEECFGHAEELAQQVVDVWVSNVGAGQAAHLTADFKALFEKANAYRNAKRVVESHRESNLLSRPEVAEETRMREAFAKEYKEFTAKQAASRGGIAVYNNPAPLRDKAQQLTNEV
jgi:hypothetical protein